ncbi:acyltransferase [Roseobacter cerasinus]|uniref:Acyltransferase n=1 Tax=Roseobacter cerasinus TaxID=2602289 RepID=A0A640VQ97_9RHOB|nr:acyltransferase family protein [Roseobacter cerasinus]GFE49917.1 acyltransferase [Roseobacter cerasinus]
MKYRPEIDSLRAVSVGSVVLYHSRYVVDGARIAQGGYLGVDIFFVISGFLITRLIALELDSGQFSIKTFYERRARRILPALTCVLLAAAMVAPVLLSPAALREFSGSILSSILFYSNFFFLFEDSYTAEISQLKPLLHTWSLSVEEQFYLLFPLLMICLAGVSLNVRMWLLFSLALASLMLAQYLSGRHFDANFFLPVTRAWELLLGSLLALVPGGRLAVSGAFARYMPSVGLLMILGAIATFTDNTAHPSLLTLLPVLGAVFIIGFANPKDPAIKLLSSRAFVAVGLISYSLYLWHFPIFAYLRVWNDGISDPVLVSFGIVTSVLLAWATWRWVEQPFRRAKVFSVRRFAVIVGTPLAGLCLVGALLLNRSIDESYDAIPPEFMASFKTYERPEAQAPRCVDQDNFLEIESWCKMGAGTSAVSFLLIGDSHADALAATLHAAALRDGKAGLLIARSGCPLLSDLEPRRGEPLSGQCLQLAARVLEFVRANEIPKVIFSSRWNYYVCGEPKEDCGYTQNIRHPGQEWANSRQERIDILGAALDTTVSMYNDAGARISFVAQVPHQRYDPKQVFNEHFRHGGDVLRLSAVSAEAHQAFTGEVKARLTHTANLSERVSLHDPADVLCEPQGICSFGDPSSSYYSDDDHLSVGASKVLMNWAAALLN